MNDLLEIIAKYQAGEATASEVATLDAALKSDSAARATYLDFCRQVTAFAELPAEKTTSAAAKPAIPWIIAAGLTTVAACVLAILILKPPIESNEPGYAVIEPLLDFQTLAINERAPDFSTWTLCQFAFLSEGGLLGSTFFPFTNEPTLALTHESFWSGDLTNRAPTSSHLTIEIP
ncbi:MAG: hypothetical protein AAF585_21265 [Verrucomicrobiota bacterium]